ncbi:hypothetical protein JL722_6199 [Aureococcus anophagefferens]|nr:hypothetical protein JL722_6199 [Aureococcus anophagefferens]
MSQPPPQPPAQAPPPAAPAQPQVAKGMLPRRLGIAAPPPGGAPEGPGGLQRPGDALMTSSPYLKSMALLDSLDLQQLMAGGDLAPARRRRPRARPESGRGARRRGKERAIRRARAATRARSRGSAPRRRAAARPGAGAAARRPGAATRIWPTPPRRSVDSPNLSALSAVATQADSSPAYGTQTTARPAAPRRRAPRRRPSTQRGLGRADGRVRAEPAAHLEPRAAHGDGARAASSLCRRGRETPRTQAAAVAGARRRGAEPRDLSLPAASGGLPPRPPPGALARRAEAGAPTTTATTAAAAAATATAKQRKDIRRERNREHARISRERKRQKLEHLQEENDALRRKEQVLVDERDRLRERLSTVEHENSQLRTWIRTNSGDDAEPPPPPARSPDL